MPQPKSRDPAPIPLSLALESTDGRHFPTTAHRARWRVFASCLVLAFALSLGAQELGPATPQTASTPQEPTGADEVRDQDAAIDSELASLRQRLAEASSATTTGPATQPRNEELRRLEQLILRLGDLRGTLDKGPELRQERDQLATQREAGPARIIGRAPPYSVSDLDALLSRRDAATVGHDSARGAEELLERSLGRAEEQQRQARHAQDRAQDELDRSTADNSSQRLQNLEQAKLDLRLAEVSVQVLTARIANSRLELALAREREEALTEAEVWARQRLDLSPEERQSLEQRLQAEEEDLRQARAAAASALANAEAGNESSPGQQGPAEADVNDTAPSLEAAQLRASVAQDRLDRLELRRELWQERFRLLQGEVESKRGLQGLCARLEGIESDLERWSRQRQIQIVEARDGLLQVENELDRRPETDPGRRALIARRSAGQSVLALLEQDLQLLRQEQITASRAVAEAERLLAQLDPLERLQQLWQQASGLWSYELFSVQDSPITLGQICVALLLMLLGNRIARWLSRLLAGRLLPRFGLDPGMAATLQTLLTYLLLVGVVLFALKLVNIPLTAFTFLGGALAIGVGFGSQNIVNNFMSGLILLVERPVKVGDLIEIDGTYGRAETIGPRSTRIRSGDNKHVIIPNSKLLESNVLNWTLSDHRVRAAVDVGVAYGSDTAEVHRQLTRALGDVELVLKQPAPEVLFMDFGNDALIFRCLFWCEVLQPMDEYRAESALRFRIDELFREAEITIAFPQRDVHLDTLKPLEVRVLDPARSAGSADTDGD